MRPETSHMSSEAEEMRPLNDIASSSTQAPVMLVRGVPNSTQGKVYKRQDPESAIEPWAKAGKPKIKYTDTRPDAEKRDGSESEDTRKGKRRDKKDHQQSLETVNVNNDADDEEESQTKPRGSGVRKTIN